MSADNGRDSGEEVECKLYSTSSSSSYSFEILHRIVLYIFSFKINTLLCYTVVSVLVLGIGIARGQYYWTLDIGCLIWYHSNPTDKRGNNNSTNKFILHTKKHVNYGQNPPKTDWHVIICMGFHLIMISQNVT